MNVVNEKDHSHKKTSGLHTHFMWKLMVMINKEWIWCKDWHDKFKVQIKQLKGSLLILQYSFFYKMKSYELFSLIHHQREYTQIIYITHYL